MITQQELKELVTYDPDTGLMHWKKRTSKHIKKPSSLKGWNTKYAYNALKLIDGKGYLFASINYKQYRLHRLAWLYVYGEWPNIIDHMNGVKTDNRLCNLRNTTHQGNHLNQKRNSKNTSGVTGVYLNKKSGIWCAQMKFNGKTYHIGSSKSFFEAVCMRKSEERKLGFSTRHGEADVK